MTLRAGTVDSVQPDGARMNPYPRIRELRNAVGLTQSQVARGIYLHTTTYCNYERGDREIPLNIAILLARFYTVSLDYITGISDVPSALTGINIYGNKAVNA